MKAQMRKLIEAASKRTLTRENAADIVAQKTKKDSNDQQEEKSKEKSSTQVPEGKDNKPVDCVNCGIQKSTAKCPHRRCYLCCSVAGLTCSVHTVALDFLPQQDYPLNTVQFEARKRFEWKNAALLAIFSAHSNEPEQGELSNALTWSNFFESIKLFPFVTQPVVYHLNAERDAAQHFVDSQAAVNYESERAELQQKKAVAERRIEELQAKMHDLLG